MEFIQGWGNDVNFNEKRIQVEESTMHDYLMTTSRAGEGLAAEKPSPKGRLFNLDYDKLVVAVGCYSQTFNTPGVRENALFLKDVSDAIKIRKKILDCKLCALSSELLLITPGFETASLPTTSTALKQSLLNFAVVGGGRKYSVTTKGAC